MRRFDPHAEARLLKAVEEASRLHSFPTSADGIERYSQALTRSIEQRWECRPYMMRVTQCIYRYRLAAAERQLKHAISDAKPIAILTETVERFRFGSQYGRVADRTERHWADEQIRRYAIAQGDAQFMVWNGTINFKQRAIVFGHWDWIIGIPMMIPVAYVAGCALLACVGPITSAVLKVSVVMSLLALTHGSYQLYKSLSFDAFRVGRRYFKPNKLGYFIKT